MATGIERVLDILLELKQDIESFKQDVKQDIESFKQDVKQDIESLKQDVKSLKQDVESLKQDVESLKQDVESLKQDVKQLQDNQRITNFLLHRVDDRGESTYSTAKEVRSTLSLFRGDMTEHVIRERVSKLYGEHFAKPFCAEGMP